MPKKSFSEPLPELNGEQARLRDELRQHVQTLAGNIGERNVYLPTRLRAAAEYIENTFTNSGYKVTRQTYTAGGENCDNLIVEIPGKTHRDEIIVVGAHYDSVSGSPGANDNGSGVACVLALARVSAGVEFQRTVRFVAFVNEEPPFFQTEKMGSLVYAKSCQERGDRIVAMLCPETMGYYRMEKGSQKYPFPMGMFYPSRGDFIAFVGNTTSAKLVRRCVKVFREQAPFPSEGGALPGSLPGVGWSDHWAFWQAGYPGVMITDTAPFRYPHYHTQEDTPDKLDYERFARVVDGLRPVLKDLADGASQ
jgi:Zn-dependent M28 family amino/carboxypeptidase